MKSYLLLKSSIACCLFTLLVLVSRPDLTLSADKPPEFPQDIVKRLQATYDAMNSLSFSFQQKSSGQVSGRPRSGSGNAVFFKEKDTSSMRWDYTEPDYQVLISDGNTFSMYFAELQQMIITPADTLDSELTYALFSGRADIVDTFHVLPPEAKYQQESQTAGQPAVIKLVPREPQSQVQAIHLWVDTDSLIRRIEMKDHFETITQINLSNIMVNSLMSLSPEQRAELFSFTPPPGTEIIRQ